MRTETAAAVRAARLARRFAGSRGGAHTVLHPELGAIVQAAS